ncbi:hypothetical protein [Eupransor demetentiae]|uniref:Uncharacterized protein n=1 Tax=Eupransor demetentiae TaxID=3109584 RepID=A0ABM9N2V7_9LACO|nr:hypothetical protein R54876_GBNLAHCA_00028 [Lactobacillaceae bacterium LMG 33000]
MIKSPRLARKILLIAEAKEKDDALPTTADDVQRLLNQKYSPDKIRRCVESLYEKQYIKAYFSGEYDFTINKVTSAGYAFLENKSHL